MLTRALVLLSGGIDSTVALWWARDRYRVTALSFDGARRPKGEIRACTAVARRARVPHVRVDLPFLEARSDGYVPGRNLVYHAAAISIAERRGARAV
ncbi:MAG TPA: 7-cyano-7-deazaguanine synthase, partial [Candidatus Krumholzibacteria bacterium]|nr:7-cyano-7-deazaguanine synthase [Candidatus Krumholzibacteria bacterium]